MDIKLQEEIARQAHRGVLLVLTGPTGAGKDALFAELQKARPGVQKIVTTTSREMRPTEVEGKDYYFLAQQTFEEKIGNDEFFEWVEFRGNLYGTQKKTLTDALASGHDVIWRIEMKGVKNIKDKVKRMTERSVFIFLTAPSIEDLEDRVHKDTRSENGRWNSSLVKWELSQFDSCDYLVVNHNENLNEAVRDIFSIIDAKRLEIVS